MITLDTKPLHPNFGVEVLNMPLSEAAHDDTAFAALRAAFEDHTALLFRQQEFSDADHLALARRFGPIENREADDLSEGDAFEISRVSNVKEDGSLAREEDVRVLNQKANMLWHTDSIFLPVPALTNILVGRVVTDVGGETELCSTRAAWSEMPQHLKSRLRDATIWSKLSHSRAQISEDLAKLPRFHKWPDQHWKAVWRNPANGREALYFASHSFRIDGLTEEESKPPLTQAMAFCTRPENIYTHRWSEGDVLIWDERAALHRGRPWDYNLPRELASICVSASAADGLEDMRA